MSQFSVEEEIDHHQFVAGIACVRSHLDFLELLKDWIYGTGASDHMTPVEDNVFDPYQLKIKPYIRLPNGDNLSYLMLDLTIKKVTGLGRLKEGLYHLVNVPAYKVDSVFSSLVKTSMQKFSLSAVGNKSIKDSYGLWHHRLGHVSDVKLKQIHETSVSKSNHDNCLSCPMAKFTKLPYSISESYSTSVFELIHIDIWGPYKVPTNRKFRYFLTMLDDCSRGTWIYLLEQKSDSFEALKSFVKFVTTQFEKQIKIVRIPSSVIGNVTPYEILLKKKPNYTSLRVFDVSLWDVVFNETVFPFAENSTKNFLSPLPTTFPCFTEASNYWDDLSGDCVIPNNQNHASPTDFVTALLVQKDPVNFKEAVADPGHRQRHGIDYQETFAPVAKMVTVRSLLAIAAVKGWFTCHMDVSNAFLHCDLFEEVYMKPPLGYTGKGHNVSVDSSLNPQLVCKLKKSLYGFKQAPRQWFFKLSSALLDFYTQSKTDYSLFVKKEGTSFIVVLVYVDDLLITGNDESQINSLKAQLSSVFHMKDWENRIIFWDWKSANLLMLQTDVGTPLQDSEVYRRFIGKLIYITVIRPDICYTVQLLSQFMQSPTSVHMQAVKHLLRYLLNSPGQGILLAHDSAIQFKAYCDSDWASCPVTRRSTTGFCVLLGDSPISWKSKKQAVVSRSSAEPQYRSMAMTCCEVNWLVNLFKDLGIKDMKPVDLFCDNQVALYIATNSVFHARTKHIEVDCHYVRHQLKAGKIKPTYVHTKSQLDDVFTKVVSVDQHTKLLSKLRVSSSNNSQLEGECTKDKG
uniref:Retrovirus-related Pol polyprotein from transposon TNT 1-94 n=1 Tax=Tanacetum cinerariifolium TaxID=118510 RepID=A0A699GML2_TANCI|nr:retrovirus-related Pol polyprotein from transposon TNT 1-94 [Tanacetum cinerariifolium]